MSNEIASQSWLKLSEIFNIFQDLKSYFKERKRVQFLSHFNLPKKGSLLDISCGDGGTLKLFHETLPALGYYGIDMSENKVEEAKKHFSRGVFSVARAENLPYSEEKFDAVISCNSFHHYDKPEQIFDEVSRVLLPGGIFYIKDFFPINRLFQWLHNYNGCCAPYHFEKYYTKKDVMYLAMSKGFFIYKYTKTGFPTGIQVIALKKSIKL